MTRCAVPFARQRSGRAVRRRRLPHATGRTSLRFGICDPRADGHRPPRDHRHHQILPGDGIRGRPLTALPVPPHRCALVDARLNVSALRSPAS